MSPHLVNAGIEPGHVADPRAFARGLATAATLDEERPMECLTDVSFRHENPFRSRVREEHVFSLVCICSHEGRVRALNLGPPCAAP